MTRLPDFDHLPPVEGMPQGCAWGIFDKKGSKDVLGTLNLLTPETTRAAYQELKHGLSVSLNWNIGALKSPISGRESLVHKVTAFVDSPMKFHGYDDEVEFNTQCSSQWDSLCHFHHQPSASAYNGVKTNAEELTQGCSHEDADGRLPTLEHWHARGGLVARGVLIDYKLWADRHGINFNPFSGHQISVQGIEQIAKDQGVVFRLGDVLIVRSGFTEQLSGISADEQQELILGSGLHSCGVAGDMTTVKWLWNQHFSAVAGDMLAFEQVPPVANGRTLPESEFVLHPWLLSLFGMPIGELWDLKALSEVCQMLNTYTFLLTSSPLNVPGLVGSPANALALF